MEMNFYWREMKYSNANQAFLNLNLKVLFLIENKENEFRNISKILR